MMTGTKASVSLFQELKNCKTLGEIYEKIPRGFYEKICFVLLCICSVLPAVMVPVNFAAAAYNIPIYSGLMDIIGNFCLLLAVWMILGEFVMHRKDILKHQKEHPWEFFLICMLLWGLLSALQAEDLKLAFVGSFYRDEGFFSYLVYAGIFVCASRIASEVRRKKIIHLIMGSSLLLSGVILVQLLATDFMERFFDERFATVFFHFNHFGYYMTIAIMLSAGCYLVADGTKHSWKYLLIMAVQMWALIINDTFGGYVAVFCSCIVAAVLFGFARQRFAWKLLVPLMMLLTVSALTDFARIFGDILKMFQDVEDITKRKESAGRAGTGRWNMWTKCIGFIKEKPLFGYGPENLGPCFERVNLPEDRPANEYLQHAAELGIPGMVFYLLALCSLLRVQLKRLTSLSDTTLIAAAAVMGYCVSAFFGNTTFYITPYFYMLLAFAAKNGKPV